MRRGRKHVVHQDADRCVLLIVHTLEDALHTAVVAMVADDRGCHGFEAATVTVGGAGVAVAPAMGAGCVDTSWRTKRCWAISRADSAIASALFRYPAMQSRDL